MAILYEVYEKTEFTLNLHNMFLSHFQSKLVLHPLVDVLRSLMSRFHLYGRDSDSQEEEVEAKAKPEQLLKELTLEGVAEYIKGDKCEFHSDRYQ